MKSSVGWRAPPRQFRNHSSPRVWEGQKKTHKCLIKQNSTRNASANERISPRPTKGPTSNMLTNSSLSEFTVGASNSCCGRKFPAVFTAAATTTGIVIFLKDKQTTSEPASKLANCFKREITSDEPTHRLRGKSFVAADLFFLSLADCRSVYLSSRCGNRSRKRIRATEGALEQPSII